MSLKDFLSPDPSTRTDAYFEFKRWDLAVEDPSFIARRYAATRGSIAEHKILMNDHDKDVRWAVAINTKSLTILEQLAKDDCMTVRVSANRRIKHNQRN